MGWGSGNLGGGGFGLNFRVLGGTAAPASPKANDIWVDTDTAVAGWHFCADEPNIYDLSTRTAGDAHTIMAPHQVSAGDILNFEIPAAAHVTREALRILDPVTGKSYYIRNGNGTAAGSWAKGTMVGVLLSNTSMPIGSYGSGSGTALIRAWGKYYHKEGEVWFPTGASSPVSFNAVKKNGLMVYPLSAKQYIGGTWVEKTAKSYQGGAWVAWWNGQLYDNGNTYTSVTGGYSAYGDGTILTENADHLYIESTGPSGVYNNTPVDMAKYNTITFTWTCVRGGIDVRFQVRSDKSTGGSGWAAGTTITSPEAKQYTTALDISSLSGSYYVGVGRFSSGGPCQLKIHSIIMT